MSKLTKGALEVVTTREVPLGVSDTLIPCGEAGYVIGGALLPAWIVLFPRLGVHGAVPKDALRPTGRRG